MGLYSISASWCTFFKFWKASWGLKQHNHTVSWIMPTMLPDLNGGEGYFAANLTVTAGNGDEVVYGLGQ